jgi:FkbM family methyltransferase
MSKKIKILCAIPTAKYIEPETFKSIYDQILPDNYQMDFQFFYGYRIDQIRNLIADWVVNGYDYLFSVDSDVAFAPQTLLKLLTVNESIVTGVYRQRLEPPQLEIYGLNETITPENFMKDGNPYEIASCGFGCVLVKREAFVDVGYPQFEYHQSLDHKNTISEDTDFCIKARQKGHKVVVNPTVICDHKGEKWFEVQVPSAKPKMTTPTDRFKQIQSMELLPIETKEFVKNEMTKGDIKVVYDIGACVGDFTKEVEKNLPNAEVIMFDAMGEFMDLYNDMGNKYHLGVLSQYDGTVIDYYKNVENPAGNSYYRENPQYSSGANVLYPEGSSEERITMSLDSIVQSRKFPMPDFIKIDVQGAELDVLKGATEVLKHCNKILIETQHVEYNIGAPKMAEVRDYLHSLGFQLAGRISGDDNTVDADYYFIR